MSTGEEKEGAGPERLSLGRRGEKIAREFLERRGYRIVAVDVRMGHHQADLLAWERGRPVVVEVKSAWGDFRPEMNFRFSQAKRLLNLGNRFFAPFFKNRTVPVRLDLVTVHFSKNSLPQVRVFQDLRLLP